MIQKVTAVSVGGVLSSGKSENNFDIENCTPQELENFITGMYKNGEISLKDTMTFRPLGSTPLADESGVDGSTIRTKYFSKLWANPNAKRNLYRDYKSVLNQMVIDGDQNISMMKNAIQMLDKMKSQRSFEIVYKNSLTQVK